MPPLNIEAYNEAKGDFQKIGQINPGDRPGSFSDNKQRRRDIILAECWSDDSFSVIQKSRFGIDAEMDETRRLVNPIGGYEVVAVLKEGQSYEIEVTPDRSTHSTKLKFTHQTRK